MGRKNTQVRSCCFPKFWISRLYWYADNKNMIRSFSWWISKGNAFQLQWVFYSHYFLVHGIKHLRIHLPNGLAGLCARINHTLFTIESEFENGLQGVEILELDPVTFQNFGFLDCTDMQTTRTWSGHLADESQRGNAFQHQWEFYSHYFHVHEIKHLSVHLPNGLAGTVFCAGLSTNDKGLINMSNLSDYL